ncbi:MAG: DUF1905 domain-containing protein [Microbacterium ginsengisoli]|uniref:DUF1905 domain-containing protein n=1 Tax=Microbacterium TaxID=33882 RepID=UPI0007000370|nr:MULTISPECIES: DUF1905 domain-containing protein [unclassified Microbacterium]MBN9199211.1 DUF1905 domain-containing protein [Microbacterium ginsengisoli]KQR90558.1 hypothetical protein ASF93_09335 [Microbacterium sp. Leaf347]KQR91397.1 hypothetical protein ASG00_05555 [Microbacterium sp. Leaf351]ODU78492.1 MAG: hypothetical protein ABT08_03965 [Microbacterium sp. SCN 71-21]OJU74293.1 MAG: hypothetical protein BGO15_12645 [Microbacterium sp. 71-23]
MQVEFTADIWRWEARAELWCFVAVPDEISEALHELPGPRAGFGSVPVEVRLAASVWRTSIFPETARGRFVLPLKKAVRQRYGLGVGDRVTVSIETVGI